MYEFQLSGKLPYKVELITFNPDTERTITSKFHAVVFVTTNDLIITDTEEEEKLISKGELFLLPRGYTCQMRSTEQNEIMIMQIPNITALYVYFIGQHSEFVFAEMRFLYTLEMENPILRITESLRMYMDRGIIDPVLAGLKAMELFYAMKRCYPKEKLENLFSPICTKEYSFALFVLSNHTKVKTAEELADLSTYSFSGFNKQFQKVFGVSPYKWMLQYKVDKIYKELLYETNKPIKLIAEEYGFASLSNLGDFCRKHIGSSPAAIRNKKSKNREY